MSIYEYKVVPAPLKGKRGPGIKGKEARFANALETLINEQAAEGWEYQRTDTLPSQERKGLTGSTVVYRNMLVFRRTEFEIIERGDARLIHGTTAAIAGTSVVLSADEQAELEAAQAAVALDDKVDFSDLAPDDVAEANAPVPLKKPWEDDDSQELDGPETDESNFGEDEDFDSDAEDNVDEDDDEDAQNERRDFELKTARNTDEVAAE